jgi:hypothetical protein
VHGAPQAATQRGWGRVSGSTDRLPQRSITLTPAQVGTLLALVREYGSDCQRYAVAIGDIREARRIICAISLAEIERILCGEPT